MHKTIQGTSFCEIWHTLLLEVFFLSDETCHKARWLSSTAVGCNDLPLAGSRNSHFRECGDSKTCAAKSSGECVLETGVVIPNLV